MSEVLDCFVLSDALKAAGIRATVPCLSEWSVDGGEWIAVVTLFDEGFTDEAALRSAIDPLGVCVEWIQHDLYSRFNHTAGGVDQGGGKTWNVIFTMAAGHVQPGAKDSDV